jgi:hypothetical protein
MPRSQSRHRPLVVPVRFISVARTTVTGAERKLCSRSAASGFAPLRTFAGHQPMLFFGGRLPLAQTDRPWRPELDRRRCAEPAPTIHGVRARFLSRYSADHAVSVIQYHRCYTACDASLFGAAVSDKHAHHCISCAETPGQTGRPCRGASGPG